MTDQHEDKKFEQWLKDAARTYHTPHPTPREAMWKRIEEARRNRHVIVIRPWMRWGLAAAAMLALGIGIGRWTADQSQLPARNGSPVAAATDSAHSDVAYQVAATQYLSRAEAFLTGFRADLPGSRDNTRFPRQARDLLSTTRLMLDSPAGDDPRLRSLLEDLELILVQISQLQTDRGTHDADLITQGMDQSNVLPKLRSAIPAGPVPVRTERAL